MTFLQAIDPWVVPVVCYLASVAIASVLICSLALVAARATQARQLRLRHLLLVAASLLTATCPLVVGVVETWDASLFGVELATAPEPIRQRESMTRATATQDDRRASADPRPRSRDALPASLPAAEQGPSDEAIAVPAATGDVVPTDRVANETSINRDRAPAVWRKTWVRFAAALVLVWTIGSLWQAAQLVRGWRRVRRFASTSRPVDDERILDLVAQSARRLQLRRQPDVFASPETTTPLSLGALKPRIVLPFDFANDWSAAQQRALIDHETAHIARGDHWIGIVQRLNRTLFWWNPACTRVAQHIAELREQICDDMAVGDGRVAEEYAAAIVKLAGRLAGGQPVGAALSAVDGSPSQLRMRVERLLSDRPREAERVSGRAAVGVVVFTAAALVVVGAAAVHTKFVQAAQGDDASAVVGLSEKLAELRSVQAAEQATVTTVKNLEEPEARGAAYAALARYCREHDADARAILWAQTALKHPLSAKDRFAMYEAWSLAAAAVNQDYSDLVGQDGDEPRSNEVPELKIDEEWPGNRQTPNEESEEPNGDSKRQHVTTSSKLPLWMAIVESVPLELSPPLIAASDRVANRLAVEMCFGKRPEDDVDARIRAIAANLQQISGQDIVRDVIPLEQRSSWIPASAAYSTEFVLNLPALWEHMPQHFNASVGRTNAWNEVVEGFEKDPYGPQIKLKAEFVDHLDGRVVVVTRNAAPHGPYGEQLLIGLRASRRKLLADVVERFVRKDPDIESHRRGGVTVWIDSSSSSFGSAMCVVGDWLLISSDMALLLDSATAINRQAAARDEAVANEVRDEIVAAETDSAPEPNETQAGATPEEIEHLQELVEAYQELYDLADARLHAGTGSQANWTETHMRLLIAKARLAEAKGNAAECIAFWEKAAEAADENVEAQRVLYDVGAVELNVVLDAQARRAETKLQLSRARRRLSDEE